MKEKTQTLLLGIDIGTTGTKCAFYTTEGRVAAHAYQEYPMLHQEEGWTEQDPELWWNVAAENLRDCFENQGADPAAVAAVCVSCTNALVLTDRQGRPLCNAIGHHDQRSDAQVEWLRSHVGEERIFSITANRLAKGSFCLPTLRWLIDNRPELVEQAHKFLMPSGFLIRKLTGVFCINRPRMSLTLMADIHTGEWSEEILERAEIPKRLLPQPWDPAKIVGRVTAEASARTGLKEGTPVTAGCLDTVAAALGSGAVRAGDAAITLGSSGRVCCISDKPVYDKRLLNCFGPFPGLYTIVQSTDHAGISMRWFRDVFGDAVCRQAGRAGLSVYEYLDRLADKAPAGSGGLVYLPYLAGEKSPIWNPAARGVFFGFSLESDYSSFVRAVMEGVAFSLRDCMDVLMTACDDIAGKSGYGGGTPIPIGGGAANSPVWCRIIADVLQRPILRLKYNETETLGDMIIAGISVCAEGVNVDRGITMAEMGMLQEPDPAAAPVYNRQFKKYKELYEHVRDLF